LSLALDPHFFRHEWGRLVAVLVRAFGVQNLNLAEDVAQETLWRAMEVWKRQGTPDNPSAWLTTTAKRLVIDELRRERSRQLATPELGRLLESEWTRVPVIEELFAPQPLRDDELRMMFSLSQPRLSEESRVSLVLHVLCGFRPEEIAAAFLTSTDAVAKRLQRAKALVAASRSLFELTDADLEPRLESVQQALYLLFNEGYHGANPEAAVREELCGEALRLVELLTGHPLTRTPSTLALSALLHLHAARLQARLNAEGELLPFSEQDRSKWNHALIDKGLQLLEQSATGPSLSAMHLQAAIAACHATAASAKDTPWAHIVSLYDTMMRLHPSPVVALNRAIAVAEAEGPRQGLCELRAIEGADSFSRYPFYEAAFGELSLRAGDATEAAVHFKAAMAVARNPMEQRFYEARLTAARQLEAIGRGDSTPASSLEDNP